MKKTDPYRRRLIVLLSFLAAVLVFFGMVMFHYQIVNGDSYRAKSVAGTAKREIVETSRGIITDRNGKVLVSNRLSYTLKFSDSSFGGDQDACNSAAWRLIDLCQQEKIQWTDPLPLAADAPFALTTDTPGETFVNWLENEDIPYTGEDSVTLSVSGGELMAMLRSIYSISDEFTDAQVRLIAGVRYGVSISDGYVFAEDVPVRVISQVVDGHYAGVSTGTSSQRVYNTTYASHILGRVNRILSQGQHRHAQGFLRHLLALVAHPGTGDKTRVRQLQDTAQPLPAAGRQGIQHDDTPGSQHLRHGGDQLPGLHPCFRQNAGGQGRHGGKATEFLGHGAEHMPGHQDMSQRQRPHGIRRQRAVAQAHHQHRLLAPRQQSHQLPGDALGSLHEKILSPMQIRRKLHGDVFSHRSLQPPGLLRVSELHVGQGVAIPHFPPHLHTRAGGDLRRSHLNLRRFQCQIRSQNAHPCGHTPFKNTKYCG